MQETDHALVERARQGDRDAIDQLLRQHADLVRRMLYRLVGSSPELEDLQQVVLLRVAGAIAGFREDASFVSWLRGICANVARDHFRSKGVHGYIVPSGQPEGESRVVPPETAVSARERLAQAGSALDRLSDEQRTVLILQRVLGHSVREIADLTETAESTTRLRLYYARKAFDRAILELSATESQPPGILQHPQPGTCPRSDRRFDRSDTFGTCFDAAGDRLECEQTPLGRAQLWTRQGRVLCTRYVGHIGPDLALCFTRRANRVIDDQGEVLTFHDWTAVTSYEPEVPGIFVRWTQSVGKRNPAIHLLFRSKVVSLAVSLASLVLPQIHAYASVDPFVAALERITAGRDGPLATVQTRSR